MAGRGIARTLRGGVVLTLLLPGFVGCSRLTRSEPELEAKPRYVAVLPIERAAAPAPADTERPLLEPGAELAVTAAIYEALASASQWRFVADQTVAEVVRRLRASDPIEVRARALGEAVGAEGVFFGTVWRFQERVGAEYGVKYPASVGFKLHLLSVPSGKVVWSGAFDETQQPLSSNLLKFWQFWEEGPKWFTAQELTRVGVLELRADLRKRM